MEIKIVRTEYATIWKKGDIEVTALGHYDGLPVNVKEVLSK